MLDSFFITGPLPAVAEAGRYQAPLVVLSYAVASFAGFTALSLAQQLVGAETARERFWLHAGGAFAMGAGIWSMHFIGMLSFKMHMAVDYDPWLTLLSMVIAIVVAYGALGIVARERLLARSLIIGAVLMGLGIVGMHYTGMAAMIMDASLRYVPSLFALSVAIAIVASGAALWLAFTLARHSGRLRFLYAILAALVMGAAISGMHYTGMWAAVFIPNPGARHDAEQNFDMLALSVAGITGLILALALLASYLRKQRTELLLLQSEAKLRAVFDHALDGLITINSKGIVESFNPACERIFGYDAEEVIGRNVKMLMPEPYHSEHDGYLTRYLKTGEARIIGTPGREVAARRKDGTSFPIDLSISGFTLEKDRHFLGIIRDITARKEADEKIADYMRALERSNQELDDFAYIASHDLKEPLRGLHNQATFLIEDYREQLDNDGARRLGRLAELSQRMQQLVHDLLYFSQLGRTELAVRECDPNHMIEEIRQLMEPFLQERNARIIVPRKLPALVCDRPRIAEVFRNLITNAVKYSDKPEPLVEIGFESEIETIHGRERRVYYVKDNGIGIAPEFHQEVFRLFKRLNAQEKEQGTGAGLTFVKKIIERHKGRIWLNSEVGKGTTFYFTLGG